MTLGAWIALERYERGLTQAQLGALLGVSYVTVLRWEHDYRRPRRAVARRLGLWLMLGEVPT